MRKLLIIVGPTSSGKSELAVTLAKRFGGEVLSADSRQVYKGMNIGSGKISKKEMEGIPHHLLDSANPKRKFSVAQYRKEALRAIGKIEKKGKLPILCGGTPFYLKALLDGLVIPEVKPDWKFRATLEKKPTQELYSMLKKMDPKRARTIEEKNPRRLIRALEILYVTKKPISPLRFSPLPAHTFWLGIKRSKEVLQRRIAERLKKRLRQGMLAEIKKLKKDGVSFKRLEEFGLEYRLGSLYIQGKISHEEMKERMRQENMRLAKRQMQWWKNDKRIHWITSKKEASLLVKKFLTSL
jgi:tRNA dimethylallyltransferase